MAPFPPSVPVLSLAQAGALETDRFKGDERLEWRAMQAAGLALATAALDDLGEAGGMPPAGRLLVLAGKGHNGGDALIAAREVLGRHPQVEADVLFAFGSRRLRPLAARAWRSLCEAARGRVRQVRAGCLAPRYDLCLDGIFGFQYRPPLPPEALQAIAASAACAIRMRAAVDLPSGLAEPGGFRADFTYATGSVKAPLLGCAAAGRPRFLDLGFLGDGASAEALDRVLLRSVLSPLAGLRPAASDKRSQGHLALVGGSGRYPGAVLMATLAALRSGVGLVTSFVPARLAPAFAARAPEAMWVGLPETPGGALSRSGAAPILAGLDRATALALGPGLGKDPETLDLVGAVVSSARVPVVMDADALQPDLVRLPGSAKLLTPHGGEFERIAQGADLRALASRTGAAVVLKGPVTAVCAGAAVYHSFFGGPVLSRGGSGDLLAGLAGGLLAQTPGDPLLAACRAAVWHGAAADLLARTHGQTAVRTADLLEFLAPALREADPCRTP